MLRISHLSNWTWVYEQVCFEELSSCSDWSNRRLNSGVIDLRDLKLKKSALDKLGLPFDVVEGKGVRRRVVLMLTEAQL